MILYFCPDLDIKSAGIRRLYDHVNLLCEGGFEAAILHSKASFRRGDMAQVPIVGLDQKGSITAGDILVIPEGFPGLMNDVKDAPVRRVVISLSWSYVYTSLPQQVDWRDYNVERVIGDSSYTTEMIGWAMSLPSHVIRASINEQLYYRQFSLNKKKRKIVFIKRKGEMVPLLMRVLYSRNPSFIEEFEWLALDDLSEEDFALHVREAVIFLNLSQAEGLAHACFEAMRSGTILCGFSSIGGQRAFCGDGSQQNSIMAETGDYLTLAWLMEPLLNDILQVDFTEWQKIVDQAFNDTQDMTRENERRQLLSFWKRLAPEAVAENQ